MVKEGGLYEVSPKGVTRQEWKNVLYIPSVSFFRTVPLLDVWRIYAFKAYKTPKSRDEVLEYLEVKEYLEGKAILDYNFSRAHPLFNYSQFLEELPNLPINDFVTEELAISIPASVLKHKLPKDKGNLGNTLVLVFRSELGVAVDRSGGSGSSEFMKFLQDNNKRFRCLNGLSHPHVIKLGNEYDPQPPCPICGTLMTFENLCSDKRFKNSCLDLKGMINSRLWAQSYGRNYNQFNVNEDSSMLRILRNYLDPHRELLRIRTYRKGKGDIWVLTSADVE